MFLSPMYVQTFVDPRFDAVSPGTGVAPRRMDHTDNRTRREPEPPRDRVGSISVGSHNLTPDGRAK
ncbi:MAG: hypothetical protein WKF75_10925, partial [Singulisphaera sp.]